MKIDFFIILFFLIYPKINFGQQLFDISDFGEFEYGQEIIKNESFEEMTENACMQTAAHLANIQNWSQIANATALISCHNPLIPRVPISGFGFKYPKTGDNLIHLAQVYLKRIDDNQWHFNGAFNSQHILQEFEEPLKQDSIYEFSVNLSPSQFSIPSIFSDCFQVKFYENINQISAPVDVATAGFSQNNPEHNFEADIDFVFEVITDTVGWLKFTSYYKAIGNEKVAVFGCFREPENINGMGVTNVNQLYYNYGMGWYIDDISLKSINSIKIPNLKINCDSLPNIITPNKDGINDKLTYLSNDEKELELIIYNRWGNIIHEEKRIQVEFPNDNSIYKDGVYFYILKNEYSTCKNSLTIKK